MNRPFRFNKPFILIQGLEDDVVIKEKGEARNLMKDIPIDPNEIEELMSKN